MAIGARQERSSRAELKAMMDALDAEPQRVRRLVHRYGAAIAAQALLATKGSLMKPERWLAERGRVPLDEDRPKTYPTARENRARRLAARLGMKACAEG